MCLGNINWFVRSAAAATPTSAAKRFVRFCNGTCFSAANICLFDYCVGLLAMMACFWFNAAARRGDKPVDCILRTLPVLVFAVGRSEEWPLMQHFSLFIITATTIKTKVKYKIFKTTNEWPKCKKACDPVVIAAALVSCVCA